MSVRNKLLTLYKKVDRKFEEQFGFEIKDATFPKIVDYLYDPKDSSSLVVTRILFGLSMLFDIPDERGGATLEKRWGDPKTCHFPLLPLITAAPMPYMALVYAGLWLGAVGIMLGYKYRITSVVFTACYWYLLLIEKSHWNNHSYLFGLVSLLLMCTQANCYWSLDAYLNPRLSSATVPYWNYFVLKYQFFILYFMAGMKKGTAEWLTGYSVQNLSEHWVFAPFQLFLTVPQIDYLVVHWFIFAFDLTVAAWMMWARTRHGAMAFCALFHLMNSRLFTIGMFPWVCLVTMPLFYPFDWPKTVLLFMKERYLSIKNRICNRVNSIGTDAVCHCNCGKGDGDNGDDNDEGVINDDAVIHDDAGTNDDTVTNNDSVTNDGEDGVTNDDTQPNDDEQINDETEINDDNDEVFRDDKIDSKNAVSYDVIINGKISINDEMDTFRDFSLDTEIAAEIKDEPKIHANEDLKIDACIKRDINITCHSEFHKSTAEANNVKDVGLRKKITTYLIFLYVFLQAFLPYSHFITKGYNNWTNGIYGYSWDMMVHSWDTHSVVVKIVDNNSNKEFYVDPTVYTLNDRWTRHGDMVYQYAHCLKNNLMKERRERKTESISENISIYIDVWSSMNGGFTQRLFDPKVDLLKTSWSPFERVSFLMPLLDEALDWRSVLDEIKDEVQLHNNYSEVLFIADFPGYDHQKYIPYDLTNVTLTVLQGPVVFEPEVTKLQRGQSFHLTSGNRIKVDSGLFHRIINIGPKPAYYMYTFVNATEINNTVPKQIKPKLPIVKEILTRFTNMITFTNVVFKNIFQICFWMPRCQ